MTSNWPERTSELNEMLSDLRGGIPATFKAFSTLAQTATAPNALDGRTKELIALGIAVAIRCDDCIAFHAKAAARHGATRAEVLETLAMAIYMGAGPSVMYASHALRAFGQFNETLAPTA